MQGRYKEFPNSGWSSNDGFISSRMYVGRRLEDNVLMKCTEGSGARSGYSQGCYSSCVGAGADGSSGGSLCSWNGLWPEMYDIIK